MSRACVAGLQLMYTIFSLRIKSNFLQTSSCIPALGGSVMTTCGLPCVAINSVVKTSFISPAKNNVLSMPFISELITASLIASATYSIPITFFAEEAIKLAMVPVPVYKSYTTSSPVSEAISVAN